MGAAYLYTGGQTGSLNTLTLVQKLTASDGAGYDSFGSSVDIDTTTTGPYSFPISAIVGATSGNNKKGAAYIFWVLGQNWVEQAILTASDGANNDDFGRSVNIHGQTAIVGAPSDDDHGSQSGAVYVFLGSGGSSPSFSQQAKLTPTDAAAKDEFGFACSIWRDTVVVGAYSRGNYAGAAYVFTRLGTTWTQQAKLEPSVPTAGGMFGIAVAINDDTDDTVIVGARSENVGGNYAAGAAYVFVRSGTTWSQQAKLVAPTPTNSGYFGSSVEVVGNTVMVGAESYGSDRAGEVYVFQRAGTDWSYLTTLSPESGDYGDSFGASVAIDKIYPSNALVGAPYVDNTLTTPNDNDIGMLYAFKRTGACWG